jgi:hypothetical protein
MSFRVKGLVPAEKKCAPGARRLTDDLRVVPGSPSTHSSIGAISNLRRGSLSSAEDGAMIAKASARRHLRVSLIVAGSCPPQWQIDLAAGLKAVVGVALEVKVGPASPASRIWHLLARCSPALRQSPLPTRFLAAGAEGQRRDDIVIDVSTPRAAPADAGGAELWALFDERDRSLASPFPGVAGIATGAGGQVRVCRAYDGRWQPLRHARFEVSAAYPAAIDRYYGAAVAAIVQAAVDATLGIEAASGSASPAASFELAPTPRPIEVLGSLVRGACQGVARRLRSMLWEEIWMIGVIEAPIETMLESGPQPTIRWVGTRADGRSLADPFGLPGISDRLYCEDVGYLQDAGAGVIKELILADQGDGYQIASERLISLPVQGHVSYPYLFSDKGALYCVPESIASRRCVLHVHDAATGWRPITTILEGVAAADPTIFHWGNHYWLAYTNVDLGRFDNLCLAYASNLRGPWRPHANNPVKVDHGSSRSAGTPFVHDGQLYRPAQDCRPGYGAAVTLNHVTVCTPTAFREQTVRRLGPGPQDLNPHGLHTLSAWGSRTLVDGKRYMMIPRVLRRKVARRLLQLGLIISGAPRENEAGPDVPRGPITWRTANPEADVDTSRQHQGGQATGIDELRVRRHTSRV